MQCRAHEAEPGPEQHQRGAGRGGTQARPLWAENEARPGALAEEAPAGHGDSTRDSRRATGRFTVLGDSPLKLTARQRFLAQKPRRTMADSERQQREAKRDRAGSKGKRNIDSSSGSWPLSLSFFENCADDDSIVALDLFRLVSDAAFNRRPIERPEAIRTSILLAHKSFLLS